MTLLEVHALWISLQTATLSVTLTAPLALLLAMGMARTTWPGKTGIDTLILLPMILSPAVLAFGLLMGLTPSGQAGKWLLEQTGWQLDFFPWGVSLASSVMALSLMVRLMRPAIERIDPMQAAIARTLGANRWQAWRAATWPQLAPALWSAMALAWALAWGETGASLALSAAITPTPPENNTAAVAMLKALIADDDADMASRLALVSLTVSLSAVYISERCRQRWLRHIQ